MCNILRVFFLFFFLGKDAMYKYDAWCWAASVDRGSNKGTILLNLTVVGKDGLKKYCLSNDSPSEGSLRVGYLVPAMSLYFTVPNCYAIEYSSVQQNIVYNTKKRRKVGLSLKYLCNNLLSYYVTQKIEKLFFWKLYLIYFTHFNMYPLMKIFFSNVLLLLKYIV